MRPFDEPWHTVVGVVADVKSSGLDKPEPPAIYAPYTQRLFTWLRWNSFVVRTHGEPQSYARAVREELTRLDPLQPVYEVAPLDTVIADSVAARPIPHRARRLSSPRWRSRWPRSASTARLGTGWRSARVRLAFAWRSARRALTLADGGRARRRLTAIGVVAGIALSLATSRRCRRCCSGSAVRCDDLGTVSALVLATGAAAGYIPARRVAVDPFSVIRGE